MIHLIMEIEDSDKASIGDERSVYNTLLEAVQATGAKVCGTLKHEFSPIGFSAVVLIGSSHASIHTWPGDKIARSKALIDYFSCSPTPRVNMFVEIWKLAGFVVMKKEVIER